MRLYQAQHRAYCGVDLHARTMFLCVLDPVSVLKVGGIFVHNSGIGDC